MGPLGRLRWQLTLSHLAAIAFTLVAMVGAVVLIGSFWAHTQGGPWGPPGGTPLGGVGAVFRALIVFGAASIAVLTVPPCSRWHPPGWWVTC